MKINKLSMIAIGALASTCAIAATSIALHQKPNKSAKVIQTINNKHYKLMIIGHHGQWLKVLDPKNDKIGWVPGHAIEHFQARYPQVVNFKRINKDGVHGFSYRISSKGDFQKPHKLTPQQQKQYRQAMNEMRQSMRQMWRADHRMMQQVRDDRFPFATSRIMMQPIVIIKQVAPPASQQKAKVIKNQVKSTKNV